MGSAGKLSRRGHSTKGTTMLEGAAAIISSIGVILTVFFTYGIYRVTDRYAKSTDNWFRNRPRVGTLASDPFCTQ
jgi:hypothetical protein